MTLGLTLPCPHHCSLGTRCGEFDRPNDTDPGKVTCKSCLTRIERDLLDPDEAIEQEARRLAKQTGRSRAVTALVAEHQADFDMMWQAHTEALMPEYREIVARRFEQNRAWEERRRQAKQAEIARLEAELARLR